MSILKKIIKKLVVICFIAVVLLVGSITYILVRLYLSEVVLSKIHEKEEPDRPVAKKFIGKVYELQHDLILIQYDVETPSHFVTSYEIIDNQIMPTESDRAHAYYWAKVQKGTKFTIKKVMVRFLHFQGELPIPNFYAFLDGFEDKGFIDVSELLLFDYAYFDEREKSCERQIAIMESVHPDLKFIRDIN